MKIEVLVSTMNLENHEELLRKMNVKKSVIINQTQFVTSGDITEGENRLYSYQEKGLSKSRNRAIENSKADICMIADDDIKYEDNYEKIVDNGYKKYPDADIIAFYVDNFDEKRKKPIRKEGKIGILKSMRIQSVQVTFKRKSIRDKNIRFNERFGAGAELYMGEENIFLAQCLKEGLKMYYIPKTIATIQDNNSTWFKGHNEYNFNVKGAVYYEISKSLYPILIFQFALRKRWLYANEVKTLKAIKYMFEGVKKYKKSIIKRIYYMGDFCSDNGPAIVNKSYYPYFKEQCYICKTNNKLIRLLHFTFFMKKCNILLVSGMSKFHVKSAEIAKMHNKEVLYLMHGYDKLEYEINEIPQEKRILLNYEEKMLQLADKIICVSQKFCEDMKRDRLDLEGKIDFVNNGVEKFEKIERKDKNSDAYTIISVGGGVKLKNNLTVCKAIKEIKDIKIKFIVIGKLGNDGEKIKKYDFVDYYEYLPHKEVLKKMEESDLYVQNSYFETFGLSIFESIACGCKILISKNVGALSIIENIDDDMIINNSNDIEEIESKIQKIYKQKDKNVTYIEDWDKHSWKNEAEKLLNLCGDLTNE